MARKKRCRVFVSYSRHDMALALPLSRILGLTGDAVFVDVKSIKPGDIWRAEINKAVSGSAVFILCWCCESAKSKMVKQEIGMAIRVPDKLLVPVRLCSMPMPPKLTDRQWIDLQGQIVHSCSGKPNHPPGSYSTSPISSSARKEAFHISPSKTEIMARHLRWPLEFVGDETAAMCVADLAREYFTTQRRRRRPATSPI
jgi:hypothetical protein